MLQVKNVSKVYEGKVPFRALTEIDLAVDCGEFVGIMGPSGSGKTTLLNTIATIDQPTTGEIVIDGQLPHQLKEKDLAKFRRRVLGFVFQDFNLLHTLTVEENIVLPLTLDRKPVKEMMQKANELAETLGITEIMKKRIHEISGGQAQRAAVARAMIHQPKLVLADEPTGNLDSNASKDVLNMLSYMNKQYQTTMLLVTHDPQAASFCDRIVFIRDGQFYLDIYQGESRQLFFQEIIDTLSHMGGNDDEVLPNRY